MMRCSALVTFSAYTLPIRVQILIKPNVRVGPTRPPCPRLATRSIARPRQGVSMSALIHPKTITVDGLSVRYAEGSRNGPDAILMSPWLEGVDAFGPRAHQDRVGAAHLVAIDPPGFGGSDYRQTLMNPKAMG